MKVLKDSVFQLKNKIGTTNEIAEASKNNGSLYDFRLLTRKNKNAAT